jgi:hypothetical protein
MVPPKRGSAEADALQPWQLFTLAGLIGATIVVFMSRGETKAGIILLSLIVFAAAFVGLAALRTFLPFAGIFTDGGAEVVGGGTRAALEREKMLLLRFIKDLEFDRRMGKVSEKDFVEMSARLRSRAARLIRQLDAGSLYREQIEREIERRLGAGSAARSAAPGAQPHPASSIESAVGQVPPREGRSESRGGPAEPDPSAERTVPLDGPAECPSCRTVNDRDAKFCKNCGARIERSA